MDGEILENSYCTPLYKNRDYWILYSGQVISQIGNSFFEIALPWYMYTLTGSKGLLGLTGFIDSLPMLAALFTGVFVERWNKKSTMMASDGVRSLAAIGIFLVAILSPQIRSGTLMGLYTLMFILSFAGTFFSPANTALLPLIIRDDQLKQAMGYSQSASAFSRLVGTFGGGGLLTLFGAPTLFLLNAVSFLISVFTLRFIRIQRTVQPASECNGKEHRFFAEWKEGVTIIFRNREILRNQVFALIANFVLGPLEIVMVAWVKGPMNGTAYDLGVINGCFAIGVLISGFFIRLLPKHIHPRFYVFGGSTMMGLCIVLMSLEPRLWYAVGLALVSSFALGIMNATVGAMFIEAIPVNLRARVGGASNALDRLAVPAGLALFGFLIIVIPLSWILIIIGVFVILSGLLFIPNLVTKTPAELGLLDMDS
ncbi:hypothetical protein ATW55_04255 [Ferroacidibacillus organovorans]|uniref:Major facilitator superfamily (MFS) profile domain-containing protein n=1 Tax=Ferroacidibacillus organovorans TaxID=1765683 RepID=A0A101XQI8_9BACL|nr:hypothetical protein ATW55_04255 [Ferroacidibacillus organovorans]